MATAVESRCDGALIESKEWRDVCFGDPWDKNENTVIESRAALVLRSSQQSVVRWAKGSGYASMKGNAKEHDHDGEKRRVLGSLK